MDGDAYQFFLQLQNLLAVGRRLESDKEMLRRMMNVHYYDDQSIMTSPLFDERTPLAVDGETVSATADTLHSTCGDFVRLIGLCIPQAERFAQYASIAGEDWPMNQTWAEVHRRLQQVRDNAIKLLTALFVDRQVGHFQRSYEAAWVEYEEPLFRTLNLLITDDDFRDTVLIPAALGDEAACVEQIKQGRTEQRLALDAPDKDTDGSNLTTSDTALTGEHMAIALKVKNKDWSVARIAKELQVHRTILYRWPEFMRVFNAAAGAIPARGEKSEDGTLEAWGTDD